jgi:hypothetical protein
MSYVVTLQDFVPGARYDGLPWVEGRIEEGAGPDGPWTALETQPLSPVDTDPTAPANRDFTTTLASSATGWFRVVFIDAASHLQESSAVYVNPNAINATGLTVGDLVDQIKDEAGFDATDTAVLRWLNARHRRMIARSRCLKATVSVGTTVANQSSYPIDTGTIEVYEVQVGGTAYLRVGRDDAANASAGRLYMNNAFYANSDNSGVSELTLYPAPETGGDAISMYAAILPPDLGLEDYTMVPIDFQDALVEGAIATGMARDIEQVAVADRFEARFDQACEELRRRVNSRIGGGGLQVRVVGINA